MESDPRRIAGRGVMSIAAKPFQQATIDAALRTLTGAGTRRFLVADEVGLGKTVVAAGVIKTLANEPRNGPLCVLYVCSNLTIARQNMKRLLSFLPKENGERDSAIGTIDRPSLLATRRRPAHPRVHVFQLTPDTAIPTRKGRRRDGRKEERALALVLIRRILPSACPRRLCRAFKGSAGKSFGSLVADYRVQSGERSGLGGGAYLNQFRQAFREALDVGPSEHLLPRLNEFFYESRHQDLVGAARTALAVAALRELSPDLVIFDEFQKFRDLTELPSEILDDADHTEEISMRTRAATRVMTAIRGNGKGDSPALLLLSATPYSPYRARTERHGSSDEEHQSSDFFELISFLAADLTVSRQAAKCFGGLRDELQKGELYSERSKHLREELTALLKPLMSRTERTSVRGVMECSPTKGSFVDEPLHAADLHSFRQMYDSFQEDDRHWIVPFWQSVPMPLQTLGSRYLAWRRKHPYSSPSELSKQQRDRYYQPSQWPHPRLRTLMAATTNPTLTMPWSRPSLPWWPLAGGWKSAAAGGDDKLLVFSRFRAVPTALSGLLSYAAESRLASGLRGNQVDYESLQKKYRWTPSPALLELFHPSPLLASLDPLLAPLGDLRAIRIDLRRQLRERLKTLKVNVVRKRKRQRKSWELLAALEAKAGLWLASSNAWSVVGDQADDEAGVLAAVLARWHSAAGNGCNDISMAELDDLATLALEAPGVVFLRALQRHWDDASNAVNLPQVVSTIWRSLRTYLNTAWFALALSGPKAKPNVRALRHAVIEGGFESTLDEHFWYLSLEWSEDLASALAEMVAALGLHGASVSFHDPTSQVEEGTPSLRLRCHVAVPLTEAKVRSTTALDAEEALRPDEVRKAFNSPFWPKVLVTTSVGQEGLDLHPWCDALVHWDLPTGPVALEQREGRITRFAGLSVRRAIASKLGDQVNVTGDGCSPWKRLADLANSQLADASGLSPWWVLQGASCKSYAYAARGSEQIQQVEALNHERALYRLVLGVPDQDDLMSVLKVHLPENEHSKIRDACLDLCAYNLDAEVALEP